MSEFTSLSIPTPMQLRGHREMVVFTLWIASRQVLVTASDDKSVRVWNISSKKAIKSFCRCFEESIDALFHFPQFENYVFVTMGRKIVLLNLDSSSLIDSTPISIFSFPADVSSLAITLSDTKFTVGDEDGNIGFYRLDNNDDTCQLNNLSVLENAHKSIVSHLLHYERGGKEFMLSSSFDCSCILWTMGEFANPLARVDFANLGEMKGQMFNPPFVNEVIEMDQDFFLIAAGDGSVKVVRKQDLYVMDSQEFHNHQTVSVKKIGNSFMSAGLDGTIQFFNAKKITKKDKGKIKTKIDLLPEKSFKHENKINSCTVASIEDKNYIVIADTEPQINIFDLDSII